MIVIACYNIKGGVGKTSTAVNLAYLASLEGMKTLIWDLDPQGAASFYYKVKPKIKGGIDHILDKKSDIEKNIKGTDYDNLDILPSDFSYRHMDLLLDESKKPQKKLKKIIRQLADQYDYIFLDCPPSISLVTESVFYASDILIIPTIPTTLSLRTLDQIIKFKDKHSLDKVKLLAMFSMVDRRKLMHRLIVDKPPAINAIFLQTSIPYASEVERMGVELKPVNIFARSSRSALSYVELWKEVRSQITG
ncbi:MAG TPA: AAA family ATPase [Gammaproteobacteria bacterium]